VAMARFYYGGSRELVACVLGDDVEESIRMAPHRQPPSMMCSVICTRGITDSVGGDFGGIDVTKCPFEADSSHKLCE